MDYTIEQENIAQFKVHFGRVRALSIAGLRQVGHVIVIREKGEFAVAVFNWSEVRN